MQGTATHTQPDYVASISKIRQDLVPVIDYVQEVIDSLGCDRHPAGRELALVKTKLQEARMCSGQGLSHFDTGFKPSDQPDHPETHSKEQPGGGGGMEPGGGGGVN